MPPSEGRITVMTEALLDDRESKTKPPLRVIRIITRLNIGGPSLQVASHAQHLPDRDISQLVVFGTPEPHEGDRRDAVVESPSRTLFLPTLIRPIRLGSDLRTLISLVGLLRREKPDIVHTHLFKAGALGRMAAILARVPIRVHTFHGTIFRGHFGRLKSRIALTVERVLARKTQALIALSESQKTDLVETDRVAARDKVTVIPPGIDLTVFRNAKRHRAEIRAQLETKSQAPVVLLLGRIAPVKNLEGAAEILAEVASQVPGLTIWIAGDGPDRPILEERFRESGLAPQTLFLGFRADPEKLLGGADLLLSTSKSEGTPTSILQAMAAECPVVSTEVGGVRDLVDSGRTGLLFPPNDLLRAVPLVADLLTNSTLGESLSQAAQEESREDSVFSMVDAHRQLYRELVESRLFFQEPGKRSGPGQTK